ncbi:Arginine biosynthesis bifunctional protein ArgJ, mitochondrial [Grifola frondosa]|uniref:Arginine biosynthesis bifunctional protein ArgJ, mitochondrial n=1 Tax=Grifola frondosa TaxID=5627 RepID=A0A1C7LQ86_GRIFR|nr:Arginine biosynthesis bifunctional protein ArgJ, mitochondrial [Grifola frondosa]
MPPPRLFAQVKRFASTIVSKPMPSKTHLHAPLPDSLFPKGYVLTGIHSGIKKKPELLDLAVILSTANGPATAAACFTRNAFKAAPVVVSQEVLQRSGGGRRMGNGARDRRAPRAPPSALVHETLVMSTGVIGQTLPIEKIIAGISSQATAASARNLGSTFEAWERAARAFMTTDTFPKLRARSFTINGKEYRLAGMDKGAGMIHPNMGPPAPAPPAVGVDLRGRWSFNSISVDGDMSTNDTIVVLANGAAISDSEIQEEIDEEHDKTAYETFRDELTAFATELAQLVVRDGEGATKFVTVSVEGAPTYEDAHKVASRISTSALVKTALFGEDANWGRILAATGSIPLSAPLDPTRVSVSFVPVDGSSPLPLLVNGEPEKVDEVRAKEIVSAEDLEIKVELGLGKESAKYWTCDFSYEYVKINGDYRT